MIITADLHLTDRERDEYRWGFLSWLKEYMNQRHDPGPVLILGDLTDEKDGHSARLVNRIIDSLVGLHREVYILKGNHDYVDPDCPFFRFLRLKVIGEGIHFIVNPHRLRVGGYVVQFLPHTRTPEDDWLDGRVLPGVKMICCHQTFSGADVGGGRKLDNTLRSTFFSREWEFDGTVVSGDIHVPQRIGDVNYVGAPYPISFGDAFEPRVLRWDGAKLQHIPVPSIRRLSLDLWDVDELLDEKLDVGDQLKVRVHLPRSEFGAWSFHHDRVIEIATQAGAEVFSIELHEKQSRKRANLEDPTAKPKAVHDPKELVREFCRMRGLDEGIEDAGIDLVGS